ncbi:MAG: aconitate hydratase [Clostridiales bacterium]|jgi:aconitate hydratase|nr:aconitate hydratase [Clostridiales bacterium]
MNVTQKIIAEHLVSGKMTVGGEISIRIDQTLTQDSTGTMAYLQFEAMGVPRVRTKRSVAYIDHNTLQSGFENADDHEYIRGVALSKGICVSRPGNGICHQVHLERFGVPGMTLLGSDSHTPTGGGLGMLAIGAGGLDVAVAMGGGAYFLNMPEVIEARLTGKLGPFRAAKDVILKVLSILTVKGGVGKVVEYTGAGVETLTVPERATIANMGAELGATASVFPSDAATEAFLWAERRGADFRPLKADAGAEYARTVEIDLSALEPMIAAPHSPDNVKLAREARGVKVDQVCIGSCTNSSYLDMARAAALLAGRKIAPGVSFTVSPGSRQVLTALARDGALAAILDSGARVLECACGPCIGMGQSPRTGAVSVRSFNRNFYGRSGTKSAEVYLSSVETAVACAVAGEIADPRDVFGALPEGWETVGRAARFEANDNLIARPEDYTDIEITRGPNIKPFPINTALADSVAGKTLIVLPDNITTDHIMPSDSKLLPYRSNIPYLSDYCLTPADPEFPRRAKEAGGGFIVAGENYGQGSSREHAALVPLYLKVKAVIAKSFARIHMDNLINNGILPLVFEDAADYGRIERGDELRIEGAPEQVKGGRVEVENTTKGYRFAAAINAPERKREILLAGGLLNYAKTV